MPSTQTNAATTQDAYLDDAHLSASPARSEALQAGTGTAVTGPDDPWAPYGRGGAYYYPSRDDYAARGEGRTAGAEGVSGERDLCGTCSGYGTVCSCYDPNCLVCWYDPYHVPDRCPDCDGLNVHYRETFREPVNAVADADRPEPEIELG